ncbi:hypothetical protein OE88DRAFT_1653304 [Heliocybe sulcata]|uniref:Uncharacterized protein n=1 Tax=Heliocybe sulcata TaxID=5364 RepID=A0A5C3NBZ1_9AGAM|nr:hypothetical protein OE88DRAFT_1653304 [Heliocybe sulcata]
MAALPSPTGVTTHLLLREWSLLGSRARLLRLSAILQRTTSIAASLNWPFCNGSIHPQPGISGPDAARFGWQRRRCLYACYAHQLSRGERPDTCTLCGRDAIYRPGSHQAISPEQEAFGLQYRGRLSAVENMLCRTCITPDASYPEFLHPYWALPKTIGSLVTSGLSLSQCPIR